MKRRTRSTKLAPVVRPFIGACLAAALLVTGCSEDSSDKGKKPSTTSTSAGVGAGGGGGGGEGGVGGAPITGPIEIGATDGTLSLPFAVSLQGEGSSKIGAFAIDADVGTVDIDGGTLAAVSYEKQPFGAYVLYQTLAVASDRLYAIWFYCEADKLTYIYYEGTDGTAIDSETATGTCASTDTATMAPVKAPALSMPLPPLLEGYTIEGPAVHLPSGEPGSVDFGGGPLTLLAFDHVDCSACGMGGWQEVHTLLWDAKAGRVCFAIFYLFNPGDPVYVTYSLTFPDLTDPVGSAHLDAMFTMP